MSERRCRMLLRKVHQHCVVRCGPWRPLLEIFACYTQLLGSLPNHMAPPFGMQLLNLVDGFPGLPTSRVRIPRGRPHRVPASRVLGPVVSLGGPRPTPLCRYTLRCSYMSGSFAPPPHFVGIPSRSSPTSKVMTAMPQRWTRAPGGDPTPTEPSPLIRSSEEAKAEKAVKKVCMSFFGTVC